jgi:hypothetical protein
MKIPKKALIYDEKGKEGNITVLKEISDSSHKTYKISFTYENGQPVEGYFKKLDEHYPALLAKISVAVSLFKRMFQGERSAEERLVFDPKGNLLGSVSISLKDFKSFNFYEDYVPTENTAKEQVTPSKKTLVDNNVIELLFGRWFLYDDDAHPHNLSLVGDIDFDMFFYWFVIWMKGQRPLVGTPNTRVNLTDRDYENFPIIKDAKSFHWPTYKTPGQVTLPTLIPETLLSSILPKRFPAPEEFEKLAGDETAQKQKFAVALKALVTFQPELFKRHLTELFGDLTFDYTSLKNAAEYEKYFPLLCTKSNDVKSFVDIIMIMYQQHYDNLYRVVVFHPGKTNNYGVALSATYDTLCQDLTFYTTIQEWVVAQNQTVYAKEPDLQYDLAKLEQRYHKIWRDSFTVIFKELWNNSYKLTMEVLKTASCDNTIEKQLTEKQTSDADLTEALELFDMPELPIKTIKSLIRVDEDSPIRSALFLLVDLTNQLRKAILTYYEEENLSRNDSLAFCGELTNLYCKHGTTIFMYLAHVTSYAHKFNLISENLKDLMDKVNFPKHLVPIPLRTMSIPERDPTDITPKFLATLFDWAKKLPSEDFNLYITNIIDNHYVKTLSLRARAAPVKRYLELVKSEANDNKLAYIFCSGTSENGQLNCLLIKHLTPLMLINKHLHLPSIQAAINDKTFDKNIPHYVKAAVHYAKTDPRFIHHYGNNGEELFFKAMYEWIDSLGKSELKGLIESALKSYESELSWLFGESRRKQVQKICGNYTAQPSKIIAAIFLAGDSTSTLNDHLFHKIVTKIKEQIIAKKDKSKYDDPGYRLIVQYNSYDEEEHKKFYKDKFKMNVPTLGLTQSKEESTCLSI